MSKVASFLLGVLLVTSACDTAPVVNPTAPTPVGPPVVLSLGISTARGGAYSPVDSTHNCQMPGVNQIQFDPTQLGRVVIDNQSACTNDYSLVIFDVTVNPDVLVASASATLAPGERRTLTVGLTEIPGHLYQRDVLFGFLVRLGQTPSDWNNAPFWAPGVYWAIPPAPTSPSTAPPSTPPSSTTTLNVCNVFWQVGSAATLNGFSFAGIVVAQAGITLGVGARLEGKALVTVGPVTLSGANQVGGCGAFGVEGAAGVTAAGGVGTVVDGAVGSSPNTSITGFPPATASGGTHANDADAILEYAADQALYIALGAGACTDTPGPQLNGASFGPDIHCFSSTADLAVGGSFTLTGNGLYIFRVPSGLTANVGSSVIH